MAHWHGLAKLRMHHDLTLDILDSVTVALGNLLRSFSDVTCPAFETKELRREADARGRRESRKAAASHYVSNAPPVDQASSGPGDSSVRLTIEHRTSGGVVGRRPKKFNLGTYKGHSYGDYAKAIREYGTTDSFSTESVRDIW
jgi:hypothetical protein